MIRVKSTLSRDSVVTILIYEKLAVTRGGGK